MQTGRGGTCLAFCVPVVLSDSGPSTGVELLAHGVLGWPSGTISEDLAESAMGGICHRLTVQTRRPGIPKALELLEEGSQDTMDLTEAELNGLNMGDISNRAASPEAAANTRQNPAEKPSCRQSNSYGKNPSKNNKVTEGRDQQHRKKVRKELGWLKRLTVQPRTRYRYDTCLDKL